MEASEEPNFVLGPVAIPVLTRKISWEDWEKGRVLRRSIALQAVGKAKLPRVSGDPRKDAILHRLNDGERGMPFKSF